VEQIMQHDVPLREAVRAIFDACYPSEDWCPVRFEEAERHGSVHYRQALEAALRARAAFADARGLQLELI
jgi:hypothetical protein